MRHIAIATYILIALHFARMVLHRITPANTHGIHTAFTAPKGYNHKVVIGYRTNGKLHAIELYTTTPQEMISLCKAIRQSIPQISKLSILTFCANIDSSKLFKECYSRGIFLHFMKNAIILSDLNPLLKILHTIYRDTVQKPTDFIDITIC